MSYLNHSFLLITVLLVGCATGYQSSDSSFSTGGFEETELAPGYFRVVFKGNGFASQERVNDLAMLRASDLMLERGCKTFKLFNSNNDAKRSYYVAPKTEHTNASVSAFGNTAYGTSSTATYGGEVTTIERFKSTVEVSCSSEDSDYAKGVIDAEFLNQSLKNKYNLSK